MACVIMNSSNFLYLLCLLSLMLSFAVCREILCIPSERETLLKLKHDLRDYSNRLSSWNATANSNCCQWAGVVCNNNTAHVAELHLNISPPNPNDYYPMVVGYDDVDYGKAEEAYMRSQFGGELNPCLVDLKHLNYLDLSGNDFQGMSIPIFLGTMTSLAHLNLSNAGFMGKIPSQIGNLSNLLYLDLQSPSYFVSDSLFGENVDWLSSLSKLEYLDLGGANLSKSFDWLHTLQALPSLMELHLSYCMLPDQYNEPSLHNFSSLHTLDLSSVYYSFVPKWIFGLKKLVSLQLHDNEIHGAIPNGIQNLTLLEILDLSSNSFSSSIPHWLYGLHHLKFLDLSNNNLHGTISDALGNLTSLVGLGLSRNQLMGTIPTSLGNLTSLVRLYLLSNQLEGTTPTSLGNLISLVGLDLSHNQLQGTIPTSLGNLTSLVRLYLLSNQLEGTIPTSLGNLISLVELDLSHNQLEGTIPTSLGKLTSLVILDLTYNQLEGTIPTSLGHLTSLMELYLSNKGTIPTSLGNLTSLMTLHLSGVEGAIPTSLGNLCNLKEIRFSYFKLNQPFNEVLEILAAPCISHGLTKLVVHTSIFPGNLSDRFWDFKNITELHISNNSIGGALPRSLGKLSSLLYLDLSNNQFTGNPFKSLGSLSNLLSLDIRDNLFQGAVKENDLASLISLAEFYASGNNFTLKVGPNWLPSFKLYVLDMRSWQLGPNFPSWLQSQDNLYSLQMSNTGISHSIPSWFWESFSQAAYINFSQNHIHGELESIPVGIVDLSSNHLYGKLPYISNEVFLLDLSSNSFSKSMDDFLCKNRDMQMQLQFLNLASNNLSGEIPDCWMIWPFLVDVNLQNNHFTGNLPPSIGSLVKLQSLQIHNNLLSGIFPTISKKNQLIFLDLGENNFSGTIPDWVGVRFLNMRILRLRSNSFSGQIPNEMCDMSHLQVLDLAQNNLSGNIPSCFNHLNVLTLMNTRRNPLISSVTQNHSSVYSGDRIVGVQLWLKGRIDYYKNFLGLVTSIDLSKNKLSGEIPGEITDLDGLRFLNLSHNQLTGNIPPTIGNMLSLLSIDFSRNQLSGEIPSTMSNLSFLSMLDLSYNHLKGKIPTGTQLQTFDASNFIGNNLCGAPLPTNCSSNGKVHDEEKSDRHGVNWFFVSMTFGFIVGFWAVVAPLFIWRSWRYAYYHFLDQVWFKLQSLW